MNINYKISTNHTEYRAFGAAILGVLQQPGGWRVAHSGANATNGVQAGFATLNTNNSSANRNTNIGSHACNNQPCNAPMPLGKTLNITHQSTGNRITTMNVLGQKQGVA